MDKKSNKIQVWNGVVEIDGDEMAHIIWDKVKQKLILPYLEFFDLKHFDLSAQNRSKTGDKVTIDAAKAIKLCKVGIKCSTLDLTLEQSKELKLKKLPSASNLIRNFLGGTIFKTPIICKNVPKLIPQWKSPIVIARHAEYAPFDFLCDKPGSFELKYTPSSGGQPKIMKVHDFTSPGCGMVQFNTRQSIEQFAYSCFNYCLEKQLPLYLSTKNTILKQYDGLFKDIFEEIYISEYKNKFQKRNIFYEHRLIDDMVAFMVKCSGGFLWACKGYDGDVQSEIIANGNGNKFLMLSELITSHNIILSENAHGTIRSHYQKYLKNEETSSNPISTIFAWTKGLYHRGQLDKNAPLKKFCKTLEEAAISTVESGSFTHDVAQIVYKNVEVLQTSMYLTTDQFIDKVAENLSKLQNSFLNSGSKL